MTSCNNEQTITVPDTVLTCLAAVMTVQYPIPWFGLAWSVSVWHGRYTYHYSYYFVHCRKLLAKLSWVSLWPLQICLHHHFLQWLCRNRPQLYSPVVAVVVASRLSTYRCPLHRLVGLLYKSVSWLFYHKEIRYFSCHKKKWVCM